MLDQRARTRPPLGKPVLHAHPVGNGRWGGFGEGEQCGLGSVSLQQVGGEALGKGHKAWPQRGLGPGWDPEVDVGRRRRFQAPSWTQIRISPDSDPGGSLGSTLPPYGGGSLASQQHLSLAPQMECCTGLYSRCLLRPHPWATSLGAAAGPPSSPQAGQVGQPGPRCCLLGNHVSGWALWQAEDHSPGLRSTPRPAGL